MLSNMFNNRIKKSESSIHSSIIPLEKDMINVNDSELYSFMMIQESISCVAIKDNITYQHLADKDESLEILCESASDFMNSMVEFFKRLHAKVKEFFGKMFLLILSLTKNTKTLIHEYSDVLKSKNVSFDISGYKYTIKNSSPNMELLNNLIKEYNSEYSQITKLDKSEIDDRRNDFIDALHKTRGKILGTNESIDSSDLREKAECMFRNGADSPDSIEVNNDYMNKIIAEYANIDKTYNECLKEKKNLEVQLESLKKYFEHGATKVKYDSRGEKSVSINQLELKNSVAHKVGDDKSYDATSSNLKILNQYFNFRYIQAKDISNITLTVLDAKVKALRDQLKQYDLCVRKWITVKEGENDNEESNTDKSKK